MLLKFFLDITNGQSHKYKKSMRSESRVGLTWNRAQIKNNVMQGPSSIFAFISNRQSIWKQKKLKKIKTRKNQNLKSVTSNYLSKITFKTWKKNYLRDFFDKGIKEFKLLSILIKQILFSCGLKVSNSARAYFFKITNYSDFISKCDKFIFIKYKFIQFFLHHFGL